MKYFVAEIVKNEQVRLEEPFLFTSAFSHLGIFTALFAGNRSVRVLGAGFVSLSDGKIVCFGKSESLDVRSRPERDASLIAMALAEK